MNDLQAFEPSEDIAFRSVEGKVMIVHPFEDQSHELDELGSLIWSDISLGKSIGEILSHILQEYDIDREKAGRDLEEFLAKLSAHKLISKKP